MKFPLTLALLLPLTLGAQTVSTNTKCPPVSVCASSDPAVCERLARGECTVMPQQAKPPAPVNKAELWESPNGGHTVTGCPPLITVESLQAQIAKLTVLVEAQQEQIREMQRRIDAITGNFTTGETDACAGDDGDWERCPKEQP